jgi:lysozyme family protein
VQHPFEVLQSEYDALLATMQATRVEEIDHVAHKLLGFVDEGRYTAVSLQTGVPILWMATSFEREASSDFRLSAAQGDPWDRVSTHVPRGRGPFPSWAAAAIDAYAIDGLDKVGIANWTEARACFEAELFNGFGYRAHGIHSPYLWAGCNHYVAGKYVADGVWDAHAVDQQLGVVPVWQRMLEIQPNLAFGNAPPPTPVPAGLGGPSEPHDTVWIQHALNALLGGPSEPHDTVWIQHALNALKIVEPPLVEDGSYGRLTRQAVRTYQAAHELDVDGFAGPLTLSQLEKDVPK